MSRTRGIEIKAESKTTAHIYLYGDVGEYGNIKAAEVAEALQEAEKKDIVVHINSGGGDVFEGIAIYNMLRNYGKDCKVKIRVEALAASAATIIALAGTETMEMPKNSMLMIHNPYVWASGDAEELRKTAELLEKTTDQFVDIYEKNAADGTTREKIKEAMKNESWFTAEETAEMFKVEVVEEEAIAAKVESKYLEREKPTAQRTEDETGQQDTETRDKIIRMQINRKKRG